MHAAGQPAALLHDPTHRTADACLRQILPATRCAVFDRTCQSRPTWLPYPRDEARRRRRCSTGQRRNDIAVIPFGGGSSVVGGVEPEVGDDFSGVVSDQPARARQGAGDRQESRAARIQAGVLGPALEAQLGPHDLTLRHFPQSFRVLDPGRLDRHPLGRPLRHALHPHRRLRRKHRAGDAPGHVGEPPPARLGRGPLPRPYADRLRRHRSASSPRPGCGCRTGRDFVPVPPVAIHRFQRRPGRCAPSRKAGIFPSNLRLLDRVEALTPVRATAAPTSWCWPFELADHDVGAVDEANA